MLHEAPKAPEQVLPESSPPLLLFPLLVSPGFRPPFGLLPQLADKAAATSRVMSPAPAYEGPKEEGRLSVDNRIFMTLAARAAVRQFSVLLV